MSRRAEVAALGLAATAYAAVLVWLTWPLAAHLRTHVPNTIIVARSDVPYIAWALAWQSHALATDPRHYTDANIYFPAPHALLYGDPGLAALPLFAPVFLATGNPALAVNVLFVGGLVITAATLHAVVRRWTGSHAAGTVAGAVFLLDPWGVWRFFSWAPSYTVLAGFPVVAWLVARPDLSWRRAAVVAPLVAFQALANLVYLAATVMPPLVVLALARIARPSTRRGGLRLAAALAGAMVLMTPVYAAYLAVRATSPALPEQSMWTPQPDSPALAGVPFVLLGAIPRIATRIPEDLVWRSAPTYLTITALAVVVAGIAARRRTPTVPSAAWRQAWLWTAMGFLMATPAMALFGGPALRLPWFVVLERAAPFVPEVVRDFTRLGLAATIGLALVAGVAMGEIAALRRRAAAAALAALVVVGLATEYRLQHTPAFEIAPMLDGRSPVVAALRAGSGPVLEVPVGSNGTQAWPHARAMYRSIFHWRPLLNGYSSYWPARFPELMALAMRLPDADALTTLRRETGLAALVVDAVYLDAQTRATWLGLAARGGLGGLRLVARDGDLLLFDVEGG